VSDPCPVCSGRGYDMVTRYGIVQKVACVVCSGTGKRPVAAHVAASRRAGRIAGIRRAERRR
jgi:hypothetical protein